MAEAARDKPSALERVLKIDADRKKLIDEAKDIALKQVSDAVDQLNSLGFDYRVVAGAPVNTPRVSRPAARVASATPHCSICDVDGHDARSHKSQGRAKRLFTAHELAALGTSQV